MGLAGSLWRMRHPNGLVHVTPVLDGGKKFYKVWLELAYRTKTLEFFETETEATAYAERYKNANNSH
jgi:hypothetical protein